MKKIVIALALLVGVQSAQAWNWVYDQAALLLAFENMTPAAQLEMKKYLGENIRQQIQTFEQARKAGKMTESADWLTILLDMDMKPVVKDDKSAIAQIEGAVEVVKNRASKDKTEVELAIRKIIELTIEMHNVGNVSLEEYPYSKEDFTFKQSQGGYGKKEKFRDRKWRHFWSYGFSVFHSNWSAEMHVRDLKVCQGRYKEQYMAGSIRDWATDMGKLVKPLYESAGPDLSLSRQAHAEHEEIFLAGVARAAFRIAALMNEATKF
jgi:hypothetical protein